jgi:hypothetical protein
MNKQHILDEIKRTAVANGGAPLGRQRLFQETGIKDSDWEKFWPRFNEAIREAGLSPNQMQKAYEEPALLEKFIAFMRDLGRFPVASELRIRGRGDPAFPNAKTFQKRLGSKQQLASKIQTYCRGRPGYDDVLALCAPIAVALTDPSDDECQPEENFGFVYLIKSGRYYKIGRSNAVGRRERELTIQLPEKANTVHSIRTDDPPGIEAYWHKRFEPKRKNGEWFDLSSIEVRAFKRRKFM